MLQDTLEMLSQLIRESLQVSLPGKLAMYLCHTISYEAHVLLWMVLSQPPKQTQAIIAGHIHGICLVSTNLLS